MLFVQVLKMYKKGPKNGHLPLLSCSVPTGVAFVKITQVKMKNETSTPFILNLKRKKELNDGF